MASLLLPRRTLGALCSLLIAFLVVAGSGGAAHAADGYRYWNYFHLQDGSWAFSQVGPGDYELKDGAVEGYRYGTSLTADGLPPRADLAKVSFDTVCEGTEAGADQIRVAVLIDYGTEADADDATPPAPQAECAVIGSGGNGQQALAEVADVRAEKGLTCAVNGYPASGCGVPVADAKPAEEQPVAFEMPQAAMDNDAASSETAEDDNDLLWPLVGVGAVLVLGAVGALALNRRNQNA
ncbi:MAG TPA: SCO2322 family protein [Marmoricola sp.]|nr:SCO2322 family protein [Marmoricola sp.]